MRDRFPGTPPRVQDLLNTIDPKMEEGILDNGARLIAHRIDVVLAKYGDKFVTWRLCPRGYTIHGNYFKDPSEARTDFIRRVGEARAR